MTSFKVLALAAALGLAACATATPYGPAAREGGAGYAQTRIESDRYRVTFRGTGEAAQLESFALRRAAELTLAQGRDWFVVDQRGVERTGGGPRSSISIGAGSYSGGRTSVGLGAGIGFPLGGGAGDGVARLEIRMGAGAKPQDVNAYDARSVLASAAG